MVRNALKTLAIRSLLAWERLESGVSYNPASSKTRHYPYDTYDRLREKDPVHKMRLMNAWMLTRYEDADTVMRDHEKFSREDDYELPVARGEEYKSMLRMDPPDHTRLRSLVSMAFTTKAVADLAPRIQSIVDRLLDNMEDRDRFDLIASFAFPLPTSTISSMLGVPAQDIGKLERMSHAVVLLFGRLLTEDQIRRVKRASEELFQYFEMLIEQRQSEPRMT